MSKKLIEYKLTHAKSLLKEKADLIPNIDDVVIIKSGKYRVFKFFHYPLKNKVEVFVKQL